MKIGFTKWLLAVGGFAVLVGVGCSSNTSADSHPTYHWTKRQFPGADHHADSLSAFSAYPSTLPSCHPGLSNLHTVCLPTPHTACNRNRLHGNGDRNSL